MVNGMAVPEDFPYPVSESREGGYLVASFEVDLSPETASKRISRALGDDKRVAAFRRISSADHPIFEVLYRDHVPHPPEEPYPLTTIEILGEGPVTIRVRAPEDTDHLEHTLRILAEVL